MIAPTRAEPGEQVPIRMVLHSYRAASGTIALYHNGRPVSLPPEYAHVNLKPGNNTFFIKLSVHEPGAHSYEAVFRPDSEAMDGIALNNSARAFSFVTGTSRALLITSDPLHDRALVDALRSEKVIVDMKTTSELGNFGLLQMMGYATIILANVPAAAFTEEQQQELAIFVKDMGSGLIMTGGDEGFGAGGWIGTAVEEVMPVTFEIKHKRVIPRGALVLIMHSCEISRGNYWGKEMAKKSVDTISSMDYLGVLAYTYSPGGANWEVPLDLNANKAAIKKKIDRMRIGDMPDFGTTLRMAFKGLTQGRARDAAQKHVIILSDGDAQPPSAKLLADFRREKISVSTIAIGWGGHVMERTMMDIAKKTKGTYYRAQNPRQLPQIFMKESKVVRRPLIIDEPFRPQIHHVDSDLLGGITPGPNALPLLGGMVLTSVKPSPNVLLPIIRATDDGDDPVLAHWQYELGKTVAFTSGYWPIWGRAWTEWDKFAKFWAQIVRWTMRQETPANFETYTKVEGNKGKIVIDALDKDASYLNFLELRSNVIGPDNKAIPLTFTQTGPGHYEAQFDADRPGQYLASVQVFEQGKARGTIRTGLSLPFSPEYRDLVPNEALLRQVAQITGGRWLDVDAEHADIFRHDLPPTEARRDAWAWILAWLLLPAFLLDVSVRRLASWLALSIAAEILVLVVLLFGLDLIHGSWWALVGTLILAELIGWTIRFQYIGPLFDFMTHSVTALSKTGERSQAALEQLKGTRARLRGDTTAEVADEGEPLKRVAQEAGTIPLSTARRRFDVGDEKGKEPVTDLDEALGGAQATEAIRDEADTPPDQDMAGEQETSMERLLRARKQAKRKRNE